MSESEDESGQSREERSDGMVLDEPVITAFATPKPPGAWASTPVHPTVTTDNRIFPLPVEVAGQNGLATPRPSLSELLLCRCRHPLRPVDGHSEQEKYPQSPIRR